MRYADLLISNWVTISKSAGSRSWAPWKMSYFPLTVITSFSGGGKRASSTHLRFFPRPAAGAIETQECSYHLPTLLHPWSTNPGFPWRATLYKKERKKYKPKEKNQEERLGHGHTQKSWSSLGKGNFIWFGRLVRLFAVGVCCILGARLVPLFKN